MNAVRPASKPSFVAALGLVLAACTASTPSPSGSPVAQPSSSATGGTLRIGIGGSADSLNPGLALLAEAFELFELVYDTPLTITDEGEYVPELATEWGVADDGVTWTVTIRDDVTFHDGTPLTAEDVAFSILLYRDNEDFPYQSSYPDVFETVVAVDPTHVEIVTNEPIGNMEYRLLFMYVLPKHIWENEDPLTFENSEMIGSGPFKLIEFESEVAEQLAANEDYYAGRPIIDEVIFQTFSNADARVAALTNGDIDLLAEFPVTAIANLRNADNVEVFISEIAAGGGFTDIIFNVLDDENCPPDDPETEEADGGVCSGHPALKEVEVRQALAMATNKQEFIDLTWLGEAAPGLGLVPNGLVEFYAADLEDYAFDSEAAAQMLEDAGYVDENDDGIRECKASQDCDDLTFRLNYATDSDTYPREAETLQGQWREVGVELEIQGLDADTVTSVCCPAFDYDVLIWGWGSDPDPQFLSGILLCSEITTGLSETGYCNPEYDDLYAQQGVEIDHAARADLIKEMQAIALRDVPYIIPYYERIIVAFRTDTFTNWPLGDPNLGLTDPSSLLVVRPTE